MVDIGRHLIIDGIYTDDKKDIHNSREAMADYLEKVTAITGMTLVFPPIAMSFPFSGETNRLIEKLEAEGKCDDSAIFNEFKQHIKNRNENGGGVSAVAVWVESHCTLHTWTERNYISIDLFSCSTYDIEPVIDYTIETLGFNKASFVCVDRNMNGDLPDVTKFDLAEYLTAKIVHEAYVNNQKNTPQSK